MLTVEGTAVKGVVFMNRIFKVIFNRNRQLVQVVPEYAKNRGKEVSESRKGGVRGLAKVLLTFLATLMIASPGYAADETGSTGSGSIGTTTDTVQKLVIVPGDRITVTSATDTTNNTITYTISANNTGVITAGNTDLVSGGTVYTALNGLQTTIGSLDTGKSYSYITTGKSVSGNLAALDSQVKTNADAIGTNTGNITSNARKITANETAISNETTNRTNEDTALSNRIGTLAKDGTYIKSADSVSANLSALDTQVKTNTDAISTETSNREKAVSDEATARTNAINALETKLTSGSSNSLASKANVDASNIGTKIDTSSETTEEAKKKKQEDNAKRWGEALGTGTIADGNGELLTGGTLYTELRPSADGFYIYNGKSTAYNLLALDSAVNALGVEKITDKSGNITYVSNLYKYFKANPETTTNDDGTVTYATDADAQGTNSVAIGPNAKTAKYTTTTTSGDTTTTTETAADHAVAMGDGATVNAAGDKGIALGNGAVTGEAEVTAAEGTTTTTTDAKGGESSAAIGDSAKANGNQSVALGANAQVLNPTGTTVSTGSTAIGSGAKVDGGNDSIALGTSATVNTVSNAMALGSGATINKTAKESIAIGKGAVTGGVDKPITLTNGTTGTVAAAGGMDSIAIGNGAVSEGNEALALGKGAKVTNGATGGDSAAAIVKTGSAAIGDGATVANSATSMALGNGASITEGENTTVIGSGAKATQTKQAFVAGYQASADSNALGSIALGDNASTHSEHTTAIGYKAEAHNADSIAIGSQAVTSDTGGGIAIGSNTSVAQGGIAVGKAANAQNISSLAIGNGAAANVNQSISIGYNAGVGTAEDEKEKNGSLVAIGTSAGNNVKGMQNVAIGASAGSAVQSSNNIAIGTNAGYGIKNVTSTTDTNPQNGYNISIGSGANYTEGNTNQNIVSSIAIGHATHAVNRAVAIGEGASAKGDSGMALGNSAASDGAGSIAIGSTASAADGNIALGVGSIAKGRPSGNARWTSQEAPKYYISVGNPGGGSTDSPMLRRISNVADGSDDHDVATVAQLQEVSNQLKNTIVGTDSDNKDVQTYSTTYIDNKVTELKNNISASKTKYFSVNPGSQTANSGGTAANGDGDVDAMAIGPNAKASNVKALAIGNNVSASGTLSIAIGTANNPSTDTTTADNPHPTSSEGVSSVAVGTSAIAQSDNSIAIGTRATTYTSNTTGTPVTNVGVQSIAIGYGAETRAENAISFGTTAKANSTDSIAVGHNAQALNTSAIVIGNSTAYGSKSITIGQGNTNNGAGVMTAGNSNSVTNNQGSTDVVKNSGIYGSSNTISSVTTSNSGNAITDVSLVGNGNELNQKGEMNVLNDVSVLGNKNTIENGTAGAYAQTVKQIAVVGSGNTVKGNTQIDYNTWGTVQRDTILGYKNTVDATTQWTPVSNLQILGNDVTATLGNSVYLGTGSSATASKSATTEAITLAKEQGDAEAIDSDEYKKATTEAEQTAIKQKYEAQHIHAANIAAMDQDGISAGVTNYDTDYTYGNDSRYNYAGSQADGVVTVGSKDATRRIQNVSAGLVGPNSTDAVNGSQLYALTRQIRFGGDNSTFGKTTAADDVNVVAKGSNEKLAITGGAEGVSNTTTTDGKSVTTVDGTKIADRNIAVIAENDALHVKLASNLKNLNTAQLGKTTATTTKADDGTETTTYSYQETLKLDGTGDNGGTLALKDAKGENGVTLRTSGATKTADVTGAETNRLLVNDKTVATTDDGLKFGGDTGTDSARKLNNKLTIKGGATTGLSDKNNIGVVSDGSGTLTVKLNKDVNLGADGSLTTGTVTAATVNATTVKTGDSTLTTSGLSIANGPSVLTSGINAGNKKITSVTAGETDTDAANYGQVKAAKTTLTAQGSNVTITPDTTSDDKHTNYTVSVSNLSYKAGTDTTAKNVTLSNGLTFQNGKNTTAVAGDKGTITYNLNDNIELGAETDSNNHIVVDGTQGLLTLGMDATINGNAGIASIGGVSIGKSGSDQVITGLTNKTWTVGTTQAVDGRAATENQLQSVADNLNTANTNIATLQHGFKVQANGDTTTESTVKADDALNFTAGNNTNVTTTKDSKQITISVDNLSVKDNNGTAQSVKLADGLNFQDGTNTMAVVGTNGSVTYDLKSSITLGTSTDEANRIIVNGTKGTITVGNLATINGNAGTASIGGVSIGKSGSDQTVTGLSNRTWVVGESTAVNGRAATEDQLQSVSNAAYTNANNITMLQQGFTVTTNNDTDKKSTVKAGDNLNFQAGKNVQISTTADSKSIEVALSGTPEFTTVTSKDASGNTTIVSSTGVTITPNGTGTQSVSLTSEGLDNGNHVIENVASGGTERTNAANIGDLQDAISNASTTATNTGFKVKGDDATSQTVKLGKQLNVVGGTTDSTQLSTGNIGVETTADAEGNATLTVKLNKNINLDSVEAGNTTLDTNGVSNGKMSLTGTGMTITDTDASKQVSVTTSGVSMGSQQIKNVADGTDAKDAVNKGQLDAVQTQVTNGWQIAGSNGQKVADIGAGKKVTFGDTTYATASVQPDGTDGAKVTYTINTAEITDNAKTGVITAPTTDGVATAQNVAQAINNAAWKIKANDNEATAIKAGTTVRLKAGNNLTLSQSDTDFTYALNDELTGIKSLTTAAQDGVSTTLAASGVTIASSGTGNKSVSLTANGLNNGGKQITDVASGGDTDTNAANISDVKRLVQASASGTTETGFNVKGDDATAKKVKLGKQLNVVGGTTNSSSLSDDNIGVVTTADDEGNATLTVKLNKDITLDSVKTGNTTLNTNGVSNGKMNLTGTGMTITDTDASKQVSVTTNGVSMGSQRIQHVADATQDTDAATLKQVKNARTVVARGSNVSSVTFAEGANNQMTYTVNVDNLSVKANNEAAKSVTLKNGLTFNNGTNTTASVGSNGEMKYDLNSTLTGLTSVTAGNSTLDTNGLTIKEGTAPKVVITSGNVTMGGNVIHNVGDGVAPTDAVNKGQLDALQSQVSGGWNLSGTNSEGTDVTAKIGAGKTVTYTDGAYTKSVVTKDDTTGNATVKVDVTTGTLGFDAGKAASVTNGLATTQDVANAINSASISVVADNTPENKTAVKAGDTIHFAKDGNLTLVQNGTTFTYGLNPEINISKVTTSDATKGSTVQTAEGVTTTDAAGNTYIQDGKGITLTPKTPEAGKTAVILSNKGLNNGGNVISGVGAGSADTDAVNVSQLKEVQAQVGSGWQIAGNDGQKVADIGAGKKVSFKTGSQYLTANTESAGTDAANVTYGLKTKTLTAADGKVSAVDTAEDGLATAKNVAETINQTYWTAASGTSGSGSHTDETANPVDKQISAGDTVTFNAGNNLSLVQNGASFTYGLQADLTGMNTITFTPRNDADGHPISLVIGKQKDGVSNDEGYYITGLDNTSWNQSNYVKNRAATEAQLASAIQQVTLASQSGGFKLSDDNNNEVSQVLGQAIGVVGDSNITTTAETTTADPNGHIKVSLNKHIDLGTDGSLQAGGVTLKNNRVTVGNNGIVITSSDSERTVSNLSNTTWETAKVNQEASAGGYKGSTKAATESQLAEAISTATSTASANEQHIKAGSYSVTAIDNGDGTKSQGVSIDIVTGDGSKPEVVKGKVVIKDVAKASDVGDVSKLHDTLKNPDGTKNVTGAINNLDNRVTGLDTRMNDIYTTAGQHSSVSSESNIVVDHSAKNESGGTDYKLSLNREKIDLDKVTIEGKSGAVTAKTVTAEEYKVGNKTYISSDGLNANSQKITNVQAGTADTDAANVGQVREADEQLAGGIAQNARNISQLGREVDKLDSRIDRVGAGAAALAALHPGVYDPNDKVDFSAGYGNYRGASAAAVGMYYHPDERTILSMGVAMGGGENMVNAGVTWKLGRRTPAAPQPVPVKAAPGTPALVPVSTAAAAPVRPVETAPAVRPVAVRTSVRPVETVAPVAPAARVRPVQPAVAPVRTADTNAQLMELLARQTAILEKLSEQKAVPAAAPAASGDDLFTDVPENHWAYECALKMEKAGVLKGLGGLQVEGNPLLTRKDFARILYTALKNGATTNPALNRDNSLNRMASEFRGELKMVKG